MAPADEAKGYGLWPAKAVAARKLAKWNTTSDLDRLSAEEATAKQYPPSQWRHVSRTEQTNALFDAEIIARMGEDLYDRIVDPPI